MDPKNEQDIEKAKDRDRAEWLDAVGWALFFIWTGVALLADLGWGVGLIGVGLIILGTSAFGRYLIRSPRAGKTMAGSYPMPWIK